MPDPSSHRYDIQRARRRAHHDDQGVPDQHADRAANEELQRQHPARPVGDPERAAGPTGHRGTSRGDPDIDEPPRARSGALELRSTAFTDHELMPDRFAYERDNASPPLEWHGVPEGTRELALPCEDPDAPNGPFLHWVVTGIAPTPRRCPRTRCPMVPTPAATVSVAAAGAALARPPASSARSPRSGTVSTRRGLALGVVVSAYAAGTVVVAPEAAVLLDRVGVAATFLVLAAATAVVLAGAAVLSPGGRATVSLAGRRGPVYSRTTVRLWLVFGFG